jgi:hypothetical protein
LNEANFNSINYIYKLSKKATTYHWDIDERENETTKNLRRIKSALGFFGVKVANEMQTFENGKMLFESIPIGTPKAGIRVETYFQYLIKEKTDFENVCLLGYLALKSMIGSKPYFKATNQYWFSRMDGKAESLEVRELSEEIAKYTTEYQSKKIKHELIENWGLKHYSHYMRGFYVSFNMDLKDLIKQAEKKKKSYKAKQRRKEEANIRQEVIEQLNNDL